MEPNREAARQALARTIGPHGDPVTIRRQGASKLWQRAAATLAIAGSLSGPLATATADANPQNSTPTTEVAFDLDVVDKAMDASYDLKQDRSGSQDTWAAQRSYAGDRLQDIEINQNPNADYAWSTNSEYGSVWDLFDGHKSVCEVVYNPAALKDAMPSMTQAEREGLAKTVGIATCLQGALTEKQMTQDGNATAKYVLADMIAARAAGDWNNPVHSGLQKFIAHQMNQNGDNHPAPLKGDEADKHDMTGSQEWAVRAALGSEFAAADRSAAELQDWSYDSLVAKANSVTGALLMAFDNSDEVNTVDPDALAKMNQGEISVADAAKTAFPEGTYGHKIATSREDDARAARNNAAATEPAMASGVVRDARVEVNQAPDIDPPRPDVSVDQAAKSAPIDYDPSTHTGRWVSETVFLVQSRGPHGKVENDPNLGPALYNTRTQSASYAVDGYMTASHDVAVQLWNDTHPTRKADQTQAFDHPTACGPGGCG